MLKVLTGRRTETAYTIEWADFAGTDVFMSLRKPTITLTPIMSSATVFMQNNSAHQFQIIAWIDTQMDVTNTPKHKSSKTKIINKRPHSTTKYCIKKQTVQNSA